jgi:hypothetical protein
MSEVSESIIRGLQEVVAHSQGKAELWSHYVLPITPKHLYLQRFVVFATISK